MKGLVSMAKVIAICNQKGGVVPAIARATDGRYYELISGHRRRYACIKLGIDSMPVIVRQLDDDEAVIAMVDSNIQREHILPSERGFSYKMKLEAIKHQGKRTDLPYESKHQFGIGGPSDRNPSFYG